jgi:hypothetical protein
MTALVVEAPAAYEVERRYVLDVVLADWLGLDYRLETRPGREVRLRLDDGDEAGAAVVVPDVLFATPEREWLTAAALPATPLAEGVAVAPAAGERLPVLYGDEARTGERLLEAGAGGARLRADVFGSAFFMLTRYEELVVPHRGAHDRFPAAASVAARAGFLEIPVVDAYVELLWSALEAVWPRLRRRPRAFGVALTHDVDDPLARLGRGPALIARQFAGDLALRRDPLLAARRARSLAAARRGDRRLDPHNTFDFMMDVSERNGLRGAFYFLANPRVDPGEGAYYVVEHPWIRRLIGHIHRRGHEVGLHPGFGTYRDAGRTAEQFARLRAVADAEGVAQEQWGGRQHFLQWVNPVTWRNWSEAGLDYDCTLAYAEAVGFRTGTCHPYRVFDLERRRVLDLEERPFQVMDVTLFAYMGLSPEQARAKVMAIARECRRYQGCLGILWHNNEVLRTAREHRFYASMVDGLA